MKGAGPWGGIYFLAFIGAAVYFVQHSIGLWGALLGILKALVWPAIIMYQVLAYFKI